MILAVLIVIVFTAALALAWIRGARVSQIAAVRLRKIGFVLAALVLQLLLFAGPTVTLLAGYTTELHMGSYLLLLAFAASNLSLPGFRIAVVGLIANMTVIFANGGRMPVALSVWTRTGQRTKELTGSGHYNNNVLTTAHTHLAFLGDIFPLPGIGFLANALSVGDILLLASGALFIYGTCRSTPEQPSHVNHPDRNLESEPAAVL